MADLSYKPRGLEKQFASSIYNTDSTMYPEDLMDPTGIYGGNFVIFYVNVNENSKFLKAAGKNEYLNDQEMSTMSTRQRGDAIGKNFDKKTIMATNVTAGAVGGYLGGSMISGNGIVGGVVGGATAAVSTNIVAEESSTFSRAQRRMRDVIALHMPADIQVKYGVQWSEENTLTTAMMAEGAEKLSAVLDAAQKANAAGGDVEDKLKAVANSSAAKGAVSAMKAGIIAHTLQTPGIGDFTSVVTGMAGNPKKEQLFRGVDYRTFNFSYRFYPKSPEEAAKVRKIIKTFKFHMHPEFADTNNFLYKYPSEFDIMYYQGGKENLNIHRHTSCVLTDLNITYGSQGSFIAFDDGMPTEININLSFKELAILNKDHIDDGY